MKNNKTSIPSKREQLLSQERALMADLESDAAEVESKLESTLKTLAIVSAGVLSVTILYKLLSPAPSPKEIKRKKLKSSGSKPSAVTASVVSIALQKLIPLAIEKFAKIKSKNAEDEKVAEPTSR